MALAKFGIKNKIAVNFLMWFIIIGGIYYWFHLVREFFPNIEPEQAVINIHYPNTTPEEVDKTVTRKIEQAVKQVDNIEKVSSRIVEGASSTYVTLAKNADSKAMLNDLRRAVEQVKGELPKDASTPQIDDVELLTPVLIVVVYGQVAEEKIRQEAKKIKEELLAFSEISDIACSGIRNSEIWIEIQPEKLEQFGLTLAQVGEVVAASNIDVPGGQIEGNLGNFNLRATGENQKIEELEQIIVSSTRDGKIVRLQDIAIVRKTYEENQARSYFKQQNAVGIVVSKTPFQNAITTADRVKEYVKNNPTRLGGSIQVKIINDCSQFISDRLDLVVTNAFYGIILIILTLIAFMDWKVAFWTASGMTISFLGTFIMMNLLGVSINMISLFGMIMVSGLIVDDAVVIGENIFTKIRRGIAPAQAAIEGSQEVTLPVVATVLTTVVAFLPMLFLEGRMGALNIDLPKIVIAALTISLLEALLILPCHLAHSYSQSTGGVDEDPEATIKVNIKTPVVAKGKKHKIQQEQSITSLRIQKLDEVRTLVSQNRKAMALEKMLVRISEKRHFILEKTMPEAVSRFINLALNWRYVTLSLGFAFAVVVAGVLAGGLVPTVLMPELDAEYISVDLQMFAGTPGKRTKKVLSDISKLIHSFPEAKNTVVTFGETMQQDMTTDFHATGGIWMELHTADFRHSRKLRNSKQIVNEIYRHAKNLPGIKKLNIKEVTDPFREEKLEILVKGNNVEVMRLVAAEVHDELKKYVGIVKTEDSLSLGKQQVLFELKERGIALGLTTRDLASQVRSALFGFEAQKLQQQDEEVVVRVVLPKKERQSLLDLSRLRIVTPSNARVPLEEVCSYRFSNSYDVLYREDDKQIVKVKVQIDESQANIQKIVANLAATLPKIEKRFPGTDIVISGQYADHALAMQSLAVGSLVAILLIYALIAVLFKSYIQPFIVMAAIPWATLGAVLGHFVMGYPLTFFSMLGIVGLAGIVVNDSLVLINYINELAKTPKTTQQVLVTAVKERLRAILLTTLTTIVGISPLMFGQSFQAQFFVPVAISIVFGLAVATVFTLVMIPVFYMIVRDFKNWFRGMLTRYLTYRIEEQR